MSQQVISAAKKKMRDQNLEGLLLEAKKVVVQKAKRAAAVKEGELPLESVRKEGLVKLKVEKKSIERFLSEKLGTGVSVKFSRNRVILSARPSLLGKSVPVEVEGKLGVEGNELVFLPISGRLLNESISSETLNQLFKQGGEPIALKIPDGWEIRKIEIQEDSLFLYGNFKS